VRGLTSGGEDGSGVQASVRSGGCGHGWRGTRDVEASRRLAVDPHSPPEFRCDGVTRSTASASRTSRQRRCGERPASATAGAHR
jgi:hypothetical protein